MTVVHTITSMRGRSTFMEQWKSILISFIAGYMSCLLFLPTMYRSSNNNNTLYNTNNVQKTKTKQQPHNIDDGWNRIDVFYGRHPDDDQLYIEPWFSQVRQDEIVMALLNNKTNGYFIDLAVNQAKHISNSYALERYFHWNGLCIEPNPFYWSDLARYRINCHVIAAVIGNERLNEVLFRFDRKENGGIVAPGFDNVNSTGSVKQYTVPLLEIFQRYQVPKEIDYFSLDVEGAEELILQNFPLQEYRIKIMTAERVHGPTLDLLQTNGYVQIGTISSFGESLWIHSSVQKELNWSAFDALNLSGTMI